EPVFEAVFTSPAAPVKDAEIVMSFVPEIMVIRPAPTRLLNLKSNKFLEAKTPWPEPRLEAVFASPDPDKAVEPWTIKSPVITREPETLASPSILFGLGLNLLAPLIYVIIRF
ncbi:MAG: hypothetical protein HC875_33390, partial [Anaerolineales bacterium]|nr:hypothetical protein [Anaerolineales bacterium]